MPPSVMKASPDLLLLNGLSAAVLLLVSLQIGSGLRLALALPFILFSPGYAIASALFPRRADLGWVERAFLSVGLSFASTSVIGLLLNFTPLGISVYPVTASLAALTLAFSAASARRRRAVPPEDAFSPSLPLDAFRRLGRNYKLALASAGAALLLVGGATAAFVCTPGAAERFTEFYILGPGGMAEGYPATVGNGGGQTITIGINNHEGAPATYSVIVRLGNSTIGTIGGIALADGEGWAQPYSLALDQSLLPAPGERARIDFILTMNGGDQPYRSLHLWVSAAGAES